MTFREYVTEVAPKMCGAHPSCGYTAGMVLDADKSGREEYAAEKFPGIVDRAEMLLPYPDRTGMRRHCLIVISIVIARHRKAKHGEDHSAEVALWSYEMMTKDEIELTKRDWWNQ